MKRMVSLMMAALLALAVTACGGAPAKEADVSALAAALRERVQFEAELQELTAEQLGNYLTLPEGVETAAYMSAGTTAEEIIAARCTSDADARALKETIQSFLADQRQEMQRYLPAEVARLEHAVLAQKGAYVVLCVTGDTAAAEAIIKEYLG